MIPAVILAFALATSALALPLTTQEQINSGAENAPQVQEFPVYQNADKTGAQSSPEIYPSFQQQNSPVTKVENVPVNVEQPQATYPGNPVLLPIQPLSVSQVSQVFRPIIVPAEAITDGRVIITPSEPIQQRSFQQAETLTPQQFQTHAPLQAGVEPQQPYSVQSAEKQTPVSQQVTQGQTYTQGQEQLIREYVNQVEKQTVPVVNYNPVPVDPNVQVYNVPQSVQPVIAENAEKYQIPNEYASVQNHFIEPTAQQQAQAEGRQDNRYTPVQQQQVEPVNLQYEGYTGQPIVVENFEKQKQTQQPPEYQQQLYSQQTFEKQGQAQQPSEYQQQLYSQQTFEKQGQAQQSYDYQQQQYTQQPVEKHANYQQLNTQTLAENQPVQQEVHNVESAVEKQGAYQLAHTAVYNQAFEPQQQVQQTDEKQAYQQQVQQTDEKQAYQQQVQQPVEKQAYHQQPEQVQAQTAEPAQQQQLYHVQPFEQVQQQVPQQQVYSPAAVGQVKNQISLQNHAPEPLQQQIYSVQPVKQTENQVPYQQATQSQTADYAPGQISKTSAVEPQVYQVQVPEVVNYSREPANSVGENPPQQNTQFQTLSVVVPQTQSQSVPPSVTSTQE